MNQAWRQRYKEHRFGVLLVILLVLLTGPPILVGFGLAAEWFDGLISVLVLAAVISLCFERQQRLWALLLGVPSIMLSLGGHLLSGAVADWPLILSHLCAVLFFLSSAVLIVRSLFSSVAVSFDSILGAVCGYLFLGLGWAVIYALIERVRPGSFEISDAIAPRSDSARSLSDVLAYYSFVTLTTVGYGDVVPTTPAARTLAWIEAMSGQFFLAVIVAGLVSILVSKNKTPRDSGEDDFR